MLTASPARAQETQADSSAAEGQVWDFDGDLLQNLEVDGRPVRRLVGNVRLLHDETEIRADAAEQTGRRIRFRGGVRIIDARDTLTAQEVLYFRDAKRGEATGDVRLSDGDAVLVSPSGTYFSEEKMARFDEGVELRDSVSVLTSRSGAYWTERKIARFQEEVVLTQDDLFLTADSVEHHREEEWSRALGRVKITQTDVVADTTQRTGQRTTWLAGGFAYHDRKAGLSRIEEAPVLLSVTIDSARADTLALRAQTLVSIRTDSLDRLVAVDSVRLWQGELSALADSASFVRGEAPDHDLPEADSLKAAPTRDARGSIELFRDPRVWFRQSQVVGDSLRLVTRADVLDSLFAFGSAFVGQLDSTLQKVQQIQGKQLEGVFQRDTLRTIVVGPNAEVIYFRSDKQSGALKDAVQLSADEITLFLEDGAIHRVVAETDIKGSYFEPEALKDPFLLSNYRWEPELRPDRSLLLDVLVRLGMTQGSSEQDQPPPKSDE